MGKVRVSFSLSLDGFGAGPDQSLQDPLGKGGMAMHEWALATRTFRRMHGGASGGSVGVDDDFAAASMANMGAWILGRNMFGPVRGPWPDGEWKGWWGDEPPYHVPVFVLTHHARAPLAMAGGTTFHFVTDGIESAMQQARAAAGDRNVSIAGGASTVRQYLAAGLIDELRVHIAPVLLGAGERPFDGVGDIKLEALESWGTDLVTHVRYRVG